MVKKSMTQTLKKKTEKFEKELEKVRTQKAQLVDKEKKLVKDINEAKAEYIVALMSESGKTIEELERFVQIEQEAQVNQSENGGGAYVSIN
ncbi:TPA: hypothetical protein TT917_001556 [Streptococcus equi subsp. zooepidemicus]|uniref:DUF4315 family protein n=1 Tax=Streptococcus equi subsp. zooepidemicus TaxID=40041 RepID=A0A7Z8ZT89_STRSZ|nr:hypothetical protein [Streptococcus equi]MCD3401584.1 hypothetical protein [Streptococcus equi subsp. zooepidemicus]VEF04888.1 Uncharacterised protein [Streptococcus equi subsp. zooepidemicus]HEL0020202.1 hypothetical protein [Streptococcus equi subsp. zooepidemicus]HEL0022700.1 hypothetical protein [Streptococcus equi subsp. zooepidemicus]HEL0040629.1 hypothetical protein [Streptococcus equi subsp. zooepidemicus]